jgi:hypothetical protein
MHDEAPPSHRITGRVAYYATMSLLGVVHDPSMRRSRRNISPELASARSQNLGQANLYSQLREPVVHELFSPTTGVLTDVVTARHREGLSSSGQVQHLWVEGHERLPPHPIEG